MKITEVINKLQEILKEHGDLDCAVENFHEDPNYRTREVIREDITEIYEQYKIVRIN
ncbi:MAG: hypothetical protein WC503_01155 [Candidatus Shapirobacteria bacterium]